jgi:hypothetical protein
MSFTVPKVPHPSTRFSTRALKGIPWTVDFFLNDPLFGDPKDELRDSALPILPIVFATMLFCCARFSASLSRMSWKCPSVLTKSDRVRKATWTLPSATTDATRVSSFMMAISPKYGFSEDSEMEPTSELSMSTCTVPLSSM